MAETGEVQEDSQEKANNAQTLHVQNIYCTYIDPPNHPNVGKYGIQEVFVTPATDNLISRLSPDEPPVLSWGSMVIGAMPSK